MVLPPLSLHDSLPILFYGVTSISPLGQGDAHERIIKAIYKAAGWDLADERFLQLQGLVATFPLSLADGLADDMARLKRLKTMLSTTAAHIDRKSTRLNSSH